MDWSYTSAYVEAADETPDLVAWAAHSLATGLADADLLVGHQLCSDLAVLEANTDDDPQPAISAARQSWHSRHFGPTGQVIDTRFDTDHILTGRSRRLVDVCDELGLDVTQPELGNRSMTALHRAWLAGDDEARERISVLNLRHSLSTAFVAFRAAGFVTWEPPVNVNDILHQHLAGTFNRLDHPTYQALLTGGTR